MSPAAGVVSSTGSRQKRLDVQAGRKGNLHGGKLRHQSHHRHRGHQRLRLRVHAADRREEPAEVHRQPGADHQNLAAQSGRTGLQSRPR